VTRLRGVPFLLCGLFCLPVSRALALNAADLPRPQSWVSDLAGVIDPEAKSELEQFLSQLKEKTNAEVAVVTIPSLEGDSVERLANELFTRWGIGVKGKDNGVLILLAMQERKVRIEVGYGLEGILPDGLCGQIIREQMAPSFKQADYSMGILQGVSAVAGIIAKNAGVTLIRPDAIPAVDFNPTSQNERSPWAILLVILIVFLFLRNPFLALFLMSGNTGRWRSGGFGGGGDFGGGFGGFGGGMSGGGGASGSW
jgi:uncharacterized protein